MTELVQVKDTMSSLEIAELTGKQHAHVMRDIRALLEQGVNQSNFGLVEYIDKKGEKRPCYNLTPKGVLILASGYDAVLREKIINRLEELETARRKTEEPALPDNRTERTLARMRNSHSRTFADRDREVAELCRKLYGSGRQPSVKTETTKPETVKAVTEQTDKASHNHRPDYVRALDSLVFVKYGAPVTSTVAIARLRGVLHSTVLSAVRAMLERMPELKSDVTPSYYIARASIKGGCAKQKRPMYLLTRRAFECYLQRTKRLKPDTLRPVFDAFSQTEARIAARPASVEQPQPQPQPQPQQTAAEVPAVVPSVQTQGDMAERMIAAMAVLTGADIKKVSEIMRKGGAL